MKMKNGTLYHAASMETNIKFEIAIQNTSKTVDIHLITSRQTKIKANHKLLQQFIETILFYYRNSLAIHRQRDNRRPAINHHQSMAMEFFVPFYTFNLKKSEKISGSTSQT